MFEKIVGNSKIKQLLNSVIEPSHAYMFTGPDGIGKYLFAKEFANKFLCTSDNKPCHECKSCLQFENDNNMDFKTIDTTENSIKIEQIREMISKIYEKPILADKKIYIINNADLMTVQAQNCLLKILEEPPQYVVIILIVSNEQAILNTIKSRCLKIRFEKIQDTELKEYLEQNGQTITNEMLKMYNGSIGKALLLHGNEEKYIKVQEIINANSKLDYMEIGKILFENKDDIKNFLEYMNTLFFSKIEENIRYAKCVEKINETIGKLRYNCNVEMLCDELMLNLYEFLK